MGSILLSSETLTYTTVQSKMHAMLRYIRSCTSRLVIPCIKAFVSIIKLLIGVLGSKYHVTDLFG